jgi:hypothetical protein
VATDEFGYESTGRRIHVSSAAQGTEFGQIAGRDGGEKPVALGLGAYAGGRHRRVDRLGAVAGFEVRELRLQGRKELVAVGDHADAGRRPPDQPASALSFQLVEGPARDVGIDLLDRADFD